MDETSAIHLASRLQGSHVGGWLVGKILGWGKSAVVCEAEAGGIRAAVKVYEPELVRRYDAEVQIERIRRQLALVGRSHPNVVQILQGGCCPKLIIIIW